MSMTIAKIKKPILHGKSEEVEFKKSTACYPLHLKQFVPF